MRRARLWVTVVIATSYSVSSPVSAVAFERSELRPCEGRRHQRALTWHFSNSDADWSEAHRTAFRSAMHDWLSVRTVSGAPLFSSTETAASGVPVRLGNYATSSNDCSGATLLRISMTTGASLDVQAGGASDFHGHATHEIGHAFGLPHTGAEDAFFGGETSMIGCRAPVFYDSLAELSSDDLGSAHWHTEPSPSPASANPSFEYGYGSVYDSWHMWGAGSGTTLTHVEGGADRGNTYGRIYWSASAGLGQARTLARTNVVSPVAAIITARTSAVGIGGTTIFLQTRAVDHPPGCSGASPHHWSSGRDLDYNYGETTTAWVTRWQRGCSLSALWTVCETPTYGEYLPGGTTPYDGMDARLYINSNRQTATGAPIPVDIDNARLAVQH